MKAARYDIMDDMGRRDSRFLYPEPDSTFMLKPLVGSFNLGEYDFLMNFIIVPTITGGGYVPKNAPLDIADRLNYLCSIHKTVLKHSPLHLYSDFTGKYAGLDYDLCSVTGAKPFRKLYNVYGEMGISFRENPSLVSILSFLIYLDNATRRYVSCTYSNIAFLHIDIYNRENYPVWVTTTYPLRETICYASNWDGDCLKKDNEKAFEKIKSTCAMILDVDNGIDDEVMFNALYRASKKIMRK